MRPIIALSLALGLVSMTASKAQAQTAPDPSVFGPNAVGVTQVTLNARHHGTTPLRGLMWYPATPGQEGEPFVYLEDDALGSLVFTAIEDAQVAESDAPSPAVVFSHGNGGLSYQSVFLTEQLASHGFVVISVDHPGNTMFDYEGASIVTGIVTRPLDVSAQIDHLELLNRQIDSPFKGRIDLDAIGVSGHSYGGYTALVSAGAEVSFQSFQRACAGGGDPLACEVMDVAEARGYGANRAMDLSDPRLKAAVPMAPWVRPVIANGMGNIAIPSQMQGGERDDTCPVDTMVRPAFEAAQSPTAFLNIFDAGHYGWTDICELEADFEDCSPPFIDIDLGHTLINTYAISFFKVHLEGDERYNSYLSQTYAAGFSDLLSYETR